MWRFGLTGEAAFKQDAHSLLRGSSGDLFGTTSKRVKTRIDSGPGHSGSPFYYYPSGCCGSHYVTGVLAGHVDFWIGTDYTGGPKGSAIRSWVIANM